MRRGMFNLILFMLMASTTVSLYSLHRQLVFQELRNQAMYLDAEELFYKARNFEWDFHTSVHSKQDVLSWRRRWNSEQAPIIYGYFSQQGMECVQVDEPFEQFVNQVFRAENQTVFMESYGAYRSCIILPLEKGGFKTFGVLKSPICVGCNLVQ